MAVFDRLFPGIRIGGAQVDAAIPRRQHAISIDEHQQLFRISGIGL
jgi:hypothetical protein